MLVLGEAGSGKSALLHAVVERARSAGFLVLSATGSGQPPGRSFAGLGALLEPLRAHTGRAAGPLSGVVAGSLGWRRETGEEAGIDRTELLPLGVLAVLAAAAEEQPLLLAVDDVQSLDTGSLDVLAAVVRRLSDSADEGIAVLFAQRGTAAIASLAGACHVVELPPLPDGAANRVLDGLDPPPEGRTRLEVLRLAAGNPLALLELGRAVADGGGMQAPAGGHLPVTDAIRAVFVRDLEPLPATTRQALLLAACGEDRLAVLESPALGVTPAAWEPAELAGLLVPAVGAVRFRHPLLQSVVYDAASTDQRRAAHTALAAALADEPGLAAWHRSAGLTDTDEATASALDTFAADLAARGDAAAAATAYERAAAITTERIVRARRLLRAAEYGAATGSVDWVLQLCGEAERLTDDPDLLAVAAEQTAWCLVVADRPQALLDRVLPAIERAAAARATGLAHDLLASASSSAYILGSGANVERLRRAREDAGCGTTAGPSGALYEWLLHTAVLAPDDGFVRQLDAIEPPPRLIGDAAAFRLAVSAGAASYFLDRSDRAIAHLGPVVATMQRGGIYMSALTAFGVLGWALVDAGRWQEAADTAGEAMRVNAVPRLPLVDAAARMQVAMTTTLRGEPDAAAAVDRAAAAFDPAFDPGLSTHLTFLRARAAVSAGDAAGAWNAYRALFDADGRPRHRHLGGLAVAEAAAAAVRVGRTAEAGTLLTATLTEPRWRSDRQSWVDARARAVLADGSDGSVDALAAAVTDPVGRAWPFDRGLAHLDLADALRRARRTAEARDVLLEAVDTFSRLGARPFEEHARRQLRAAGVSVAPTRSNPLVGLPAQQVQIVRLAADGLTNQEIGDRLFLSPRTVASHLYRAFPKLGVASRAHLPELLARVDADHTDPVGGDAPTDR